MDPSVRGAIDLVRLGTRLAQLRGQALPAPGRRNVCRRRGRRALRPAPARGGLRAHARGDRARTDPTAVPQPMDEAAAGKSADAAAGRPGRSLSGSAGPGGRARPGPPDPHPGPARAPSRPPRTTSRPRSAGSTGPPSRELLGSRSRRGDRARRRPRPGADPALRAQARKLAARLFVKRWAARPGHLSRLPPAHPEPPRGEGDLDLDLTLEVSQGRGRGMPTNGSRGAGAHRGVPLSLLDGPQRLDEGPCRRAGGDGRRRGRARPAPSGPRTSVIAFAADALVIQAQNEVRRPEAVVDELLSLRGKGRTDLALALRTAAAQLATRTGADGWRSSSPIVGVTAGTDPRRRSPASTGCTSSAHPMPRIPSRRAGRSPPARAGVT